MKAATFVFLIFQLSSAVFQKPKTQFLHWQVQFGKHYDSVEEAREAFKNFLQIKQSVDAHNREYQQGLVTFRQSANMFADVPKKERARLAESFIPTPPGLQGRAVTLIAPGRFPPAPDFVDWRQSGAITPVKDQGFFCNNCWAFSAIAGLEAMWYIENQKKHNFSEQFLIDCNRNDFTGNWGCKGGSQSSAYDYIRDMGIVTSDDYPYQEDVPHDEIYPCRYNMSQSKGKIKGYYRLRPLNETLLAETVAALGPVVFGFNGSIESYMYYESGIYDDPACTRGLGHSALIVGYGTATLANGTKIDYWLCKNSWSEFWGEAGYFRMVRGKNMCGLTSFLIVPMV